MSVKDNAQSTCGAGRAWQFRSIIYSGISPTPFPNGAGICHCAQLTAVAVSRYLVISWWI